MNFYAKLKIFSKQSTFETFRNEILTLNGIPGKKIILCPKVIEWFTYTKGAKAMCNLMFLLYSGFKEVKINPTVDPIECPKK